MSIYNGGEGVEIGSNLVHVVVEWPLMGSVLRWFFSPSSEREKDKYLSGKMKSLLPRIGAKD